MTRYLFQLPKNLTGDQAVGFLCLIRQTCGAGGSVDHLQAAMPTCCCYSRVGPGGQGLINPQSARPRVARTAGKSGLSGKRLRLTCLPTPLARRASHGTDTLRASVCGPHWLAVRITLFHVKLCFLRLDRRTSGHLRGAAPVQCCPCMTFHVKRAVSSNVSPARSRCLLRSCPPQ